MTPLPARPHLPARAAAAALLSLCPIVAASAAVGGSTTAVDGFALDAAAAAVQVVYDDLDAPSPAHPTGQGSAPYSAARLSTGPTGHALASLAWPGPTVANVGTAATALGAPDGVVPNYPLRVESSWPQGPAQQSNQDIPGTTMTTHSTGDASEAGAGVSAFVVPGLVSAGALASDARTAVEGGVPVSEATASVGDLRLVDGLVTIRSVRTTARVTSDGAHATPTGRTVVTGLVVAGLAVDLDEDGGGAGGQEPPFAAVTDAVERQVLDQVGVRILLVRPDDQVSGAVGRRSVGGLVIAWTSPDGRRSLVVSLGAATVGVGASTGLGTPASGGVEAGGAPGTAGDGPVPAGPAEVLGLVPGDTDPGPAAGPVTVEPVTREAPLGTFAGIGAGAVLLALALVAGAAGGLRRVVDGASGAPPGAACPGERGWP